jgi:two-component system LytT family response regulator
VIFTTAFDEYAIKAFESQAVDYLLKPYSKERFSMAIQKWQQQRSHGERRSSTDKLLSQEIRQPEEKNRIVVRESGNIRIIPVHDVQYLEAYDDYVKIYTGKEMFLKKKTMGFYEKNLDTEQFVRVHRSFIINLTLLTNIEPREKYAYVALLKSGVRVPLSKSGYNKLKSVLGL